MTAIQVLEKALTEVGALNAEGWNHEKQSCLVLYTDVVSTIEALISAEKATMEAPMTWPGSIGG